MEKVRFVNIHTHTQSCYDEDVLGIYNLFVKDVDDFVRLNTPVSLSIHPWYFQEYPDKEIKHLMELSSDSNVLAIGEYGFDKIKGALFEIQEKVFTSLAVISEDTGKPSVIHCVRATEILLQQRKKYRQPWIVHRFSGNLIEARHLTDRQIFLSFGDNLLKNKRLQDTFRQLALSHVFFETDDADMDIREIYKFAAALRNISVIDLKEIIYDNFKRIFK